MKYLLSLFLFAGLVSQLHAQNFQSQINTLENQIVVLRNIIRSQEGEITQLRNSPIQALAPFVTVDLASENGVIGPNVVFTGCNVHVVNGTGITGTVNGTGNLIVGYNETDPRFSQTDRSGSHNLIIGRWNRFTNTAYGGFVGGEWNLLSSVEDAILGGGGNSVSAPFAVVLGGAADSAPMNFSVVIGGYNNTGTQAYGVLLGTGVDPIPPY